MSTVKIGDIVARKSYGCDIQFRVADVKNNGTENIFLLKGIVYRLEADAPESDLVFQPPESVVTCTARYNTYNKT